MILTIVSANIVRDYFFQWPLQKKPSFPDFSSPFWHFFYFTQNDSNSIYSLFYLPILSVCTCTDRIFFLLPRINSMFLTIFRDPPISLMFLRRESHSNQKTIWLVKFRNNSRDSIFSREYLYFRISLIISLLITISLHVKIISTSFVRKKKLVQNHVTRIYT